MNLTVAETFTVAEARNLCATETGVGGTPHDDQISEYGSCDYCGIFRSQLRALRYGY